MHRTTKSCIYCDGRLQRVRKGEHVIPQALGSSETIRCVCHECNNVFSILDQHLITCSPVHLVDYRLRMTKGGNWFDIDHDDDNLIIESYPDSNQTTWITWPQMIFCERGTQIRGDYEEFEQIGAEDWQARFFTNLCAAYERYKAGDKRAILFSRNTGMSLLGRYPPRVFAERSIREFARGMRFRARYEEKPQRDTILAELGKLTPKTRLRKPTRTAIGSKAPGGVMRGDAIKTYCALTKIAINALAHCCERTEVDRYAFRDAVRFVRLRRLWTDPKRYLARCGFVRPVELRPLGCPENAHVLHLCHYAGAQLWQMYFVFFGGDVGGRIEFPGPNQEAWASTTIIAPFGSAFKSWNRTCCEEVVAPEVEIVAWTDEEFLRKVVPSVSPIIRESGELTIRRYRRPR